MKKYIVITAAVLFSSCNHAGKALKEKITGADSVAINFFKGDGSMDTVTAVKIISDKTIMQQLTDAATAQTATAKTGCGYDGSIHFFRNNMVVQDIDFRMNSDDCNQFTFVIGGENMATALSGDAKTLLQQVKNR